MNYQAWYEKYRPKTIKEIILPNSDIRENIESFYNDSFIRGNVLSYGAAGFGKTSVSEILIHKIIKSREDLYILGRKTDDVEDLKRWLQQRPVHSKQKIVKVEEMDRLSSQAQIILKDGLMEKYQNNCAFLATTNNPEKIDPALLTRFNTKINFKELPAMEVQLRLMWILSQEKIQFEEKDLEKFVKQFLSRGMRDMINNLELASIGGTFNLDKINSFVGVSDSEDNIIQYIVYLMKYLETKQPEQILTIIKDAKSDEHFWTYYEYMLKILKFDLRINFDYIFESLLKSDLNLFQNNICMEYYQNLDLKRFKSMHLISMVNDMMLSIYSLKGGIYKKIDDNVHIIE